MIHLYFVRHGKSQSNMHDTWGDRPGSPYDLGLTETGRKQAQDGAELLAIQDVTPDLIICSPLMRAQETAKIYADALGYDLDKIEQNDLLVEIQVGELEGTSYSKFLSRSTYADFGQYKGAETIEVLQKRAAKALDYLQTRPEKIILVVSHSCYGRAFIRNVEGRPYTDEFDENKNAPLPYGVPLKLL